MSLTVHHAPGTAALAEGLAVLLGQPVADPFVEEVVVVPTRGVERWLAQRLSHRLGAGPRGGDGVCAGVRFLAPHSLVAMLLHRDHDDPWAPDRLVWPVLEAIDASLDEPWCATLATHLGHGDDGPEAELRRSRRWSVAHRLARLFDRYAVQRPTLLAEWRRGSLGDDTDGAAGRLEPDLAWQAELWRRVLPRVGAPAPDERQTDVLARLAAGGQGLDLPGRLSLFGHTRLPVAELELLEALGERRAVHLWLPVASARLWEAVRTDASAGPVPRADDTTADLVGHPLLASLGRDSRELGRALAHLPASPVDAADPAEPAEPAEPTTLLGWLQADLRADAVPDAATRSARVVGEHDRSVQVHACHGASRQVDVLREVLVGLLQDDPTLEPRDIVVMCPDVESFAPLVSAGFGLAAPGSTGSLPTADGHPAHGLRVRLADRGPGRTNPLLALAGRLLELAGARVTASEVLDLAATDVVRRRFALTDEDLERASAWVGGAGVRWGLDRTGRAAYGMGGFEENTWRAGLDRLLLGVTMSDDDHRFVADRVPLDDVSSSEIDLAGRLAELVDRLRACLEALAAARTAAEWTAVLADGVRSLGRVDAEQSWQLPELDRELRAASGPAGDDGAGAGPAGPAAGSEVLLRLPDARALLESRASGRPTRANFRSGTLTVCTLQPMRSVPHRVVCLVGLDDGAFPRTQVEDGDDVLARRPLTGERDRRAEDRQLLLDAVLAAAETLVVTYTGADEHSGQRRPPAVPLGELMDAADRTAGRAERGSVRDHVLTRHPLQPHDPRNLKAGEESADPPEWSDPELRGPVQRPFAFDLPALAGARAAVAPPVSRPRLLDAPLPAPATGADDLSLEDLRTFLLHPARGFLRDRLEVSTPRRADELLDAMPVSLDALQTWQVGDRLLREVLAGSDPQAVMTTELLGGRLAPGTLGHRTLSGVVDECRALWERTAHLRDGEARSVDVEVDLGEGRRLVGTVPHLYGHRRVDLSYSRLKARQRLACWIDLLALTASDPDGGWTSHAVGKGGRARPQSADVPPLDPAAALRDLVDLVRLRDDGLRIPLAAPVATALAWAEAQRDLEAQGHGPEPAEAAAKKWATDPYDEWGYDGEDADAAHVRIWGTHAPLSVLEQAGLARHAWRIWAPVLAVETVGAR